jgi:hypothetical protein
MKNTFTKFCILHHKPPLLLLQQNAVALVFMNAVVAFWETCQNEMKMKKKAKWKKYIIPMSRFADTNLHQKRVMVTIKERWNANRPGTMWSNTFWSHIWFFFTKTKNEEFFKSSRLHMNTDFSTDGHTANPFPVHITGTSLWSNSTL